MNTPTPKINFTDKGQTGTESEVNAQGGGAGPASTRMNTAALGGINTNLINSHMTKINTSMKAIQDHIASAGKPIARVGKAKPKSEADAGSMKGYDPNLGMPKAKYSRTK